MAAVLAKDALLDRVTIDLAGKLTPELLQVEVDILRQCLPKNCPAQQLRRGIAGQLTKLTVDAQHPAGLVDLHYAGAYMLVTGSQPLIARPHPVFRARVGRLEAPARRTLVEAVDRPDDVALFVLDRRDMHDDPYMRAIGPFEPTLNAADWNPGSEHFRHRGLFVRRELAVEVELVRSAVEFAVITGTRRPPP